MEITLYELITFLTLYSFVCMYNFLNFETKNVDLLATKMFFMNQEFYQEEDNQSKTIVCFPIVVNSIDPGKRRFGM